MLDIVAWSRMFSGVITLIRGIGRHTSGSSTSQEYQRLARIM